MTKKSIWRRGSILINQENPLELRVYESGNYKTLRTFESPPSPLSRPLWPLDGAWKAQDPTKYDAAQI